MSGSPHVALANWYQFMPGEEAGSPRVKSRMLLWCRSGAGQVWVDGRECRLGPGDFLVLPWGHAIRYRAARRQPFLVAGAHLVPRLSGAFQAGVAHAPGHPLFGSPNRGDDPALPAALVAGRLDDHPSLAALAEHLAHAWARKPPDAAIARAQGDLLLAALRELGAAPDAVDLPGELKRLDEAVRRHLGRAWDLPRLAETAGCSQAWLTRLGPPPLAGLALPLAGPPAPGGGPPPAVFRPQARADARAAVGTRPPPLQPQLPRRLRRAAADLAPRPPRPVN
ncbi:MAG: AraC family ligand binding domain-containing protein [Minicystis sp.]